MPIDAMAGQRMYTTAHVPEPPRSCEMRKRIQLRVSALHVRLGFTAILAVYATTAAAADGPTIAKDSIRITFQNGNVRGGFEKPGWVPAIEYRVNGPIASGSNLSVEFTLPGKNPWVTFDCRTGETEEGRWWRAECGGESISNEKAVDYTGAVGFTIRLRNELSGTNLTLFTGKAKVGKTP